MTDEQTMILDEWKEVRESLRYFGNKRFAQLTVFIAASGFLFNTFFAQTDAYRRGMLALVGGVLSLLFAVMEFSSWRYWREFARRGELIETALVHLELMRNYRPKEKFLSATCATFIVYFAVLGLWIAACSRDTGSPQNVPQLVQTALDGAPKLSGNHDSKWQLASLQWNPAGRAYEMRLRETTNNDIMLVIMEAGTGIITQVKRPAP